jgi:hypothetical protein
LSDVISNGAPGLVSKPPKEKLVCAETESGEKQLEITTNIMKRARSTNYST